MITYNHKLKINSLHSIKPSSASRHTVCYNSITEIIFQASLEAQQFIDATTSSYLSTLPASMLLLQRFALAIVVVQLDPANPWRVPDCAWVSQIQFNQIIHQTVGSLLGLTIGRLS